MPRSPWRYQRAKAYRTIVDLVRPCIERDRDRSNCGHHDQSSMARSPNENKFRHSPSKKHLGTFSARERLVLFIFLPCHFIGFIDNDNDLDEHLDRVRVTTLVDSREAQCVDL